MIRRSKREIERAVDDLVEDEDDIPEVGDSEVVVVVSVDEIGEPINQEIGEHVDTDEILVADFTETST